MISGKGEVQTITTKVYAPSKRDGEAVTLLMKANEFDEMIYLVIEDGPNLRGAYRRAGEGT